VTTAIRVQLVESLAALAPHADAWTALLERAAPGRGFYYRPEALAAMAPIHAPPRHTGGRRSPFLLLAWRGEALVGALPLVLEQKPLHKIGLRRLLLWGGDGSAMGFEGELPLAGHDTERLATCRALRDALAGPLAGRFHRLELGYLRGDSPALPALRATFADGAWSDEPLVSHHAELADGLEAWRATRRSGRLRELGRLRRRLEAAHTVHMHETAELSPAELAAVMALHGGRQATLAGRGWQREAVFTRAGYGPALEALLAWAGATGRARHRLLYANGELICFLLAFVEGNTMLAWLTAVHDDYTAYGPGGLLFREAVEREAALGAVSRVEFGPGTTFVKDTMGTHQLVPQRLTWTAPTLVARVRVGLWEQLRNRRGAA
jgi:hypothetical protein